MKKQFFTDKKIFKTKDNVLKNKKIRILSKMGLSNDFHTSRCKDEKNNFYVLKIRKEKSKITKQKFLTEIYLLKTISNQKDSDLRVPKFLDSNTKKSPEWVLYKFSKGHSIGWWSGFEDWFLDKHFKDLPKLVLDISNHKVDINKLKKISYSKILKSFNKRKKNLTEYLSKDNIKKGIKILRNNKKALNKADLVLTHGDLHPGNILLNKSNKLVIIDWFNAHLNNSAFDVCFVWFSLWGYPEKQKEFFKKTLKESTNKKQFEKLFSLNKIILTPKFLEIMNNIKKETTKDSEEYEDIIEAEEFFVKTFKEVVREYEK